MSSGGGRGGETDSPRVGLGGGLHQRGRKFPRRSSSGYISDGDAQPSPPPTRRPGTADRATQTASPAGQVMLHALHRMAEDPHAGPRTPPDHDGPIDSSETRRMNSMRETRAETFGRELRLIGDDYNRLILFRRECRGLGVALNPAVLRPRLQPRLQRPPAAMLCVSLLLVLIGRFMYLQNSTNS